jgi:hypothetical protein
VRCLPVMYKPSKRKGYEDERKSYPFSVIPILSICFSQDCYNGFGKVFQGCLFPNKFMISHPIDLIHGT